MENSLIRRMYFPPKDLVLGDAAQYASYTSLLINEKRQTYRHLRRDLMTKLDDFMIDGGDLDQSLIRSLESLHKLEAEIRSAVKDQDHTKEQVFFLRDLIKKRPGAVAWEYIASFSEIGCAKVLLCASERDETKRVMIPEFGVCAPDFYMGMVTDLDYLQSFRPRLG